MNWFGIGGVIIAFIITATYRSVNRASAKHNFLSDKKWGNYKYNSLTISYFIIGLVIVQFFLSAHSSGTGQVNLFPQGASSKNYRVDAVIDQPTNYLSLFLRDPHNVYQIWWPDGGTVSIAKCLVPNDGRKLCDIGDTRYYVEIDNYHSDSNDQDNN